MNVRWLSLVALEEWTQSNGRCHCHYNAPKLMEHLMWQGNAPERVTTANGESTTG